MSLQRVRDLVGRPTRIVSAATAVCCVLVLAGCSKTDDEGLPPVAPTSSDDTSAESTAPSSTDPSTPTTDAPTTDAPTTKTPTTKTPPTTTVSPPPEGADLDRAQQSAYENALGDHRIFGRAIRRLTANPEPTRQTALRLRALTYQPLSERMFESIQRYHKARVRIVGKSRLWWQVPLEVDLANDPRPMVQWKQCADLGSVRVIKANGDVIPQDDTGTISVFTAYADSRGFWKVSDIEEEGPC